MGEGEYVSTGGKVALTHQPNPPTVTDKLSWLKWALASYVGDVKSEAAFWQDFAAKHDSAVKLAAEAKATVFSSTAAKIEGILAKLGE